MTQDGLLKRAVTRLGKRTMMTGAEPSGERGWEEPLEEQQLDPLPDSLSADDDGAAGADGDQLSPADEAEREFTTTLLDAGVESGGVTPVDEITEHRPSSDR